MTKVWRKICEKNTEIWEEKKWNELPPGAVRLATPLAIQIHYCHSTGLCSNPWWKLDCKNLSVPEFSLFRNPYHHYKGKPDLYIGEIRGQCPVLANTHVTLLKDKHGKEPKIFTKCDWNASKLNENFTHTCGHVFLKAQVLPIKYR